LFSPRLSLVLFFSSYFFFFFPFISLLKLMVLRTIIDQNQVPCKVAPEDAEPSSSTKARHTLTFISHIFYCPWLVHRLPAGATAGGIARPDTGSALHESTGRVGLLDPLESLPLWSRFFSR
jgi:hypothetical protein